MLWPEKEARPQESRMIRLAISADGHVNEPGDLWTRSLPSSMVEQGPRVEVRDGMISMIVESRLIRKLAKM